MNHNELLTQATCAVLIKGEIVGTAWLASDEGHLLTAGHVLGTEKPVAQVEVQFVGDIPRVAYKLEWMFHEASGLDFAVLKLQYAPADRFPLPISLSKEIEGQFRLYGYGTTLKNDALSSSKGEFLGVMHIGHSLSNTLLRLRSSDLSKSGYSGGAVFSDEEEAVVGIQIEAAKRQIGPEAGIVLALPLYRITQLLEVLNLLPKKIVETAPSLPVEQPLQEIPSAPSWNDSLFTSLKRFQKSLTGWWGQSSPTNLDLPESNVHAADNEQLTQEVMDKSQGGGHHFGHSSTSNIKRLAKFSSKPQKKVSSTIGYETLSFEERAKLVEHLLAIPSIVDRSRRATMILQLRSEIKTNVAYNSADKIHVFNIVETCLQYPNGMQELSDILQFFEHNSLPMQRFKEVLNRLLPRELDFGQNDDQGQSQADLGLGLRFGQIEFDGMLGV